MKLKQHITISAIISAFLFVIFKSWTISVISFISGVMIDCDHILDYFREYGINLQIYKFFRVCSNLEFHRGLTILHSWELLFLLGACAFLTGWHSWVLGIFIGFTQHIILDQAFNRIHKWGYFFFWRMKNNFVLKKIYPD